LRHGGFPIPSPAALGRIGDAFRRAMASYAEANHIPWIRFGKGDRKIEVMRPYLEAAARTGRSQVAAIGVAAESSGSTTRPGRRPPTASRGLTTTAPNAR